MDIPVIVILFFIDIIILATGTFVDVSPAILLLTPVFLPSMAALGVSRIQFGVILISGLAVGLALLMLTIGGFGGMVNASYGMNSMVHNTMWVTAHFHLIFGGTTVIMYFAIAYYLWPRITGREMSAGLANTQLWLWFIGILVLTIPWHLVGLLWMPRRTAWMPYDPEFVAQWQPSMTLMAVGGVILAVSALLFVVALLKGHAARAVAGIAEGEWAEPVHPVLSVPRPLNGFALWNWILLVAMVVSFGYPLLQFFFIGTHNALPWGV